MLFSPQKEKNKPHLLMKVWDIHDFNFGSKNLMEKVDLKRQVYSAAYYNFY